ncbi:MAG: hypothetical protein QNK04_25685 [Myxococcota bacterium]|nr:hypothetical protein [Myxococcota bacterium]
MRESVRLSTGRVCQLARPALPFLAHYHVLTFSAGPEPPTPAEIDEMLVIATQKARALGRLYFCDEECFSLVYNAGRTRRRPWPHVHILPTASPAAKRIAFLLFSLKHLLRPLRSALRRVRARGA